MRQISKTLVDYSLGQYFQISIQNVEARKTTFSWTRMESKGLQENFPEPMPFSQDQANSVKRVFWVFFISYIKYAELFTLLYMIWILR